MWRLEHSKARAGGNWLACHLHLCQRQDIKAQIGIEIWEGCFVSSLAF